MTLPRSASLIPTIGLLALLAGCVTTQTADAPDRSGTAAIPVVGSVAPDFALAGSSGAPIRLSESRGFWIVLHFHEAADLPDCVCRSTYYTAAIDGLRDLDAIVLAVSDLPADQLADRQKRHGLSAFLLSDAERSVVHRWGLWDTSPDVLGRRGRVTHSTFLIDPQGTIAERWIDDEPVGHGDRVRAALARHTAAGKG